MSNPFKELGFEKKEAPAIRKISDDFDVQDGQAR